MKQEESNHKETVTEKGVKKVDAVVTGLILGGIIASIYGVKKLRDQKDESHETSTEGHGHHEEEHQPKKSILRRIFFGN